MNVRLVGFVAWSLLLALQILWHALLAPPAPALMASTLVLCLVPLLLPLLALRNPRRGLLWVAIVCLFYFSHGVAEAWSHPHLRLLAGAEIVLSLMVILAAGFDGRSRKKRQAGAAP